MLESYEGVRCLFNALPGLTAKVLAAGLGSQRIPNVLN